MRRWPSSVGAIILSVLLTAPFAPVAAGTALEVTVSTNRPWFTIGDTVLVRVEACNRTGELVSRHYSMPCDRDQYQIFSGSGVPPVAFSDFGPWCLPYTPIVVLEPGECRIIGEWEWLQREGGSPQPNNGSQVAPGEYAVFAHFLDTTAGPTAFRILADDPVAFSAPVPD